MATTDNILSFYFVFSSLEFSVFLVYSREYFLIFIFSKSLLFSTICNDTEYGEISITYSSALYCVFQNIHRRNKKHLILILFTQETRGTILCSFFLSFFYYTVFTPMKILHHEIFRSFTLVFHMKLCVMKSARIRQLFSPKCVDTIVTSRNTEYHFSGRKW